MKKLTVDLPDHISSLLDILQDSNPTITHHDAAEKYSPKGNDITENVQSAFEGVQPIRSQLATSSEDTRDISGSDLVRGSQDLLQPKQLPVNVQQPKSIYDNLQEKLSNPPLRENFHPSKLRRVGAAITGGLVGASQGAEAGAKVSSEFVNRPYTESYQDWMTGTNALKDSVNLDLARRKADTAGLSDYASYIRAITESDPESQRRIASAKTSGEEEAKEPGRIRSEAAKQAFDRELEEIRAQRERANELLQQEGRETITKQQIDAQNSRLDKILKSRDTIASAARTLRKQIADANNETKKTIAGRAARVIPSQQAYGRAIAEDQVARGILDPKEYNALFNEITDNNGKKSIKLKPIHEVDPAWITKYKEREKQINTLLDSIIKYKVNNKDESDDDGSDIDIDQDDDIEIEEVNP